MSLRKVCTDASIKCLHKGAELSDKLSEVGWKGEAEVTGKAVGDNTLFFSLS